MTGYSIFNHAQFGHVEEPKQEQRQAAPQKAERIEPVQQQRQQKRVRSPRGWAVEAGLGLGRAFK